MDPTRQLPSETIVDSFFFPFSSQPPQAECRDARSAQARAVSDGSSSLFHEREGLSMLESLRWLPAVAGVKPHLSHCGKPFGRFSTKRYRPNIDRKPTKPFGRKTALSHTWVWTIFDLKRCISSKLSRPVFDQTHVILALMA